ncbi:hypothetical protein CSC32_3891 [Pseudomonas aeruginosa]|nr:hypothetical protein CSC32_3891 [Pseudomonas aeruginosa]RCG89638.1 hypothetical protein CSB86_0822 [Pseudomonas aeruginosa]
MVGIASARRMPYCLVTGDGFLTHRCRGARVLSSRPVSAFGPR